MNTFLKNSWIQKLIIAIVIVLLFNFIYPHYSNASWDSGTLIRPVTQLVLFLGDGALGLMQYAIMGDHKVIVQFSDDWWDEIGAGLMIVGGIVAGVVAGFFTGGAAWIALGVGLACVVGGYAIEVAALADDWDYPIAKYNVEYIIRNVIPAFDVNFINPMESVDNDGKEIKSTAEILQKSISNIYISLRNFALVVLMLVLIYVAIRIMISSTASDKSKYKQMLGNWVVAICLLFLLHYIMSFGLTLVDEFNKAIEGKAIELRELKLPEEIETPEGEKTDTVCADFLGYVRFCANDYREEDMIKTFLFILAYLVLVILTGVFTVKYLKRVIYMAFLTMVAPLIAITYPIDKLKDGKAQAFDFWIKEYTFNLMIQPLHYLLYIILISMASDLIYDNPVYTLVALGFLLPAEKFFRQMFGMDKAASEGGAGNFAAGALASQAVNKLASLGKGKGDKDKDKDKDDNKIRTQDNPELDSGKDEENQDTEDDGNVRTNDDNDYWGENDQDDNGLALGAGMGLGAAMAEDDENIRQQNLQANEENALEEQQNLETSKKFKRTADDISNNENQGTDKQRETREKLTKRWEKQKNPGRIRKFAKKVGGNAAFKAGTKYLKKKFRGVPGTLAGAYLAATAGTIALAAEIADGKPGVAKYIAPALVAGYAGGKGVLNNIDNRAHRIKSAIDKEKDPQKESQKASSKDAKKFQRQHQDNFRALYGSQNADRYMQKALELQAAGMDEEQIYNKIDQRFNAYEHINSIGSADELEARFGTSDIGKLEDGFVEYMDSGVSNFAMIDSAMQIENTGVEYDGVGGRTHSNVSRQEGIASALETQKIEDRYNMEREESLASGKKVRTRQEIGDAYMQNKRANNVQKAREKGMDQKTAEAFANRSEATTKKIRSNVEPKDRDALGSGAAETRRNTSSRSGTAGTRRNTSSRSGAAGTRRNNPSRSGAVGTRRNNPELGSGETTTRRRGRPRKNP